MKHAGETALNALEPMLAQLRGLEGIRERKRGIFYRKASAFIHFHEDPAGTFADLRNDREWLRLRVNTASEQRRLVQLAAEILRSQ